MTIYIGTYIADTADTVETVYTCDIDKKGNSITTPAIQAGPNPSFLCFNAQRTCLYAVNELARDIHDRFGVVHCLKKNTGHTYTKHSEWSTNGNYPCHVTLSKEETLLFVTNYGSGTLCAYSITKEGDIDALVQTCTFSGSSIHPERQEASHPHQSLVSLCGKYLLVTDLGCDCIYVFSIQSRADTPLKHVDTIHMPKGLGPRHMAFSECNKYLYVSGELSLSVVVCSYQDGVLNPIQNISVFPDETTPYPRSSAAEIAYYKGNVYMSNRGDDSIAVFNAYDDGTLQHIHTIPCGGSIPRNFKIFSDTPWGGQGTLVVANQGSHSITFFSVHDGMLTQIQAYASVPSPSVIL